MGGATNFHRPKDTEVSRQRHTNEVGGEGWRAPSTGQRTIPPLENIKLTTQFFQPSLDPN